MRKPDRCKGVRWSMQRDSVKMAPRYIQNVKTSVEIMVDGLCHFNSPNGRMTFE